jgi:hypothetical protein
MLADFVDSTDAFVQVVGLDFRWLAINRSAASEFEKIFGVRPRVGDHMLDLLADKPVHRAAVEAVWRRALAGEEFTETGEFGDASRVRRFSGRSAALRPRVDIPDINPRARLASPPGKPGARAR